MFGWIKEILDIRYENKRRNRELELEVRKESLTIEPEPPIACESCETLKQQLAVANEEKRRLLDRILDKPEKEVVSSEQSTHVILPKVAHPRWAMQRQELEANDRRAAQIMRQKKEEEKTPPPTTEEIKEFEKAVDEATQAREEKHG